MMSHNRPEIPTALISIHDVTPATLPAVQEIRGLLQPAGCWPVTLLVIPGSGWEAGSLSVLQHWIGEGCDLAGHGWQHHCDRIHGIRHWLHSKCISRDVAEHYSHGPDSILEQIHKTFTWFALHEMPQPKLYVPPAWALGNLPRRRLQEQPFPLVETLTGIIDVAGRRNITLPLTGYEADTPVRAGILRANNHIQRQISRKLNRPLRIAIHPHDLHLQLANDLKCDLNAVRHLQQYRGIA